MRSSAGRCRLPHVRRLDLGSIRQVVQIDASPIGQNARSTPATYSGAFDHIRRAFAESAYARRRHWTPGHFSFNTREGQCPTCRGLGHIDLDVQYLPDITVQCPTCQGARFNDASLAVRVDGLTIADVLGLSVQEAVERFDGQASIAGALRPVDDVGLGYLRLGEPTPSLSGGESQRLRIASRLRTSQRGERHHTRNVNHRAATAFEHDRDGSRDERMRGRYVEVKCLLKFLDGVSRKGLGTAPPTLLTRCRPAESHAAALATPRACARSLRSATTICAARPADSTADAVASNCSRVRAQMTTSAPASASARAHAAPMSRPAPVTSATWPSTLNRSR